MQRLEQHLRRYAHARRRCVGEPGRADRHTQHRCSSSAAAPTSAGRSAPWRIRSRCGMACESSLQGAAVRTAWRSRGKDISVQIWYTKESGLALRREESSRARCLVSPAVDARGRSGRQRAVSARASRIAAMRDVCADAPVGPCGHASRHARMFPPVLEARVPCRACYLRRRMRRARVRRAPRDASRECSASTARAPLARTPACHAAEAAWRALCCKSWLHRAHGLTALAQPM